jgi:hypothetical protein
MLSDSERLFIFLVLMCNRTEGLIEQSTMNKEMADKARLLWQRSVEASRSKRRFLPFPEVQPEVCHFGP